MEGAAADELPIAFGDDEVGHGLVVGDGLLLQEDPSLGEGGDERADRSDVCRRRWAYPHVGHLVGHASQDTASRRCRVVTSTRSARPPEVIH